MSESPDTMPTPSVPRSSRAATAGDWMLTLAICFAVVCFNVGGCSLWSYFSGLTWHYPAIYYFLHWFLFLLCLFFFIQLWVGFVWGKWLNALVVFLTVILSFYPVLVFHRRYDPYERGFAEALRRADLKPLSQWAAAHLPPKSEYASLVPVEDSSIPDEVWRAMPFKGGRPFLQFLPTTEDDTWMLTVDHSGGFISHNGFILTLGKDIDPKTTGWVIRTRSVIPHVWVFAGM